MPEQNQNNLKNRKVSWAVFIWAISVTTGLIVLLSGWFFTGLASLNGEVKDTNDDIVDVKILLGGMRTDISWIKDYMEKNSQ